MDLHYGQVIRLGASLLLAERPHYLFSSASSSEGLAEDESLMCLYGRAAPGTLWRVLPARHDPAAEGGRVAQRARVLLESVATGRRLCSDTGMQMNSYGNEWRAFGTAPAMGAAEGSKSETWSFVSSQWAEAVVASLRLPDLVEGVDPRELLTNPSKMAEHELRQLETEGPCKNYAVLARIFPRLRRSGMHVIRKLRRMCLDADVHGSGKIPATSFSGVLSWVAVRLEDGELDKLLNLFGEELHDEEDVAMIDYRKFFAMMGSNLAEVRLAAVRDGFEKLQELTVSGFVEVTDLHRHWNPRCHPDVQAGRLTQDDASADFFSQWRIADADGVVSWEDFLDYYRDVSMAMDKDDLFVELVRSAWRLDAPARCDDESD